MNWLDLLGWGGSALLIFSLLQARVLRLRALNLVACVILTIFNGILEIWPMVAMNVALAAINTWFIVALLRHQHDEAAFEVLQVRHDDRYLRHVLRVHAADIARFQPDFSEPGPDTTAYLVIKGDETVGVVILRVVGDTGHVLLDYVTRRFRDFSPGEFVWRRSGLLRELGISLVVTPPRMVAAYYETLGFHRFGDEGSWVLELN